MPRTATFVPRTAYVVAEAPLFFFFTWLTPVLWESLCRGEWGANVKKNVRLTEDCQHGFKVKATNHTINSCQIYIRHFGRFSILAKVFQTRISIFSFSPLHAPGNTKLSEPSFCNFLCCSIASGLCLVTNRKTLIQNKI